jgi:ATP-dependent DNA ligase
MKTGDGGRLISRNGIHHSNRYPALVQALDALSAASFLLDGEIAIYDQALVSRFEWMRARPKDALATEPVYMVFDLLELGGKDLRGLPLWQRRSMLAGKWESDRVSRKPAPGPRWAKTDLRANAGGRCIGATE